MAKDEKDKKPEKTVDATEAAGSEPVDETKVDAAEESVEKPLGKKAKKYAADVKSGKKVTLVSGDDRALEAQVNGVKFYGKSVEVDSEHADDLERILTEAGFKVSRDEEEK